MTAAPAASAPTHELLDLDADRIDQTLTEVSSKYAGWQTVVLPPTWKEPAPRRLHLRPL